ncbi:hypothetical protein ENBRE01_2425 [Enteropsectra breve]|nr:hypothetical protein ENBRE01_2425 [Enteropsectra breve]
MDGTLLVFDSDYIKENVITVGEHTLLRSNIAKGFTKVYITKQLRKDVECDVMIVKIDKDQSFSSVTSFETKDCLIFSSDPLKAIEFYLSFKIPFKFVAFHDSRRFIALGIKKSDLAKRLASTTAKLCASKKKKPSLPSDLSSQWLENF